MGEFEVDGKKVEVELKEDDLRRDGRSYSPRNATLEERRVKPMSSIVLNLIVIVMIGIVALFGMSQLLGLISEDDSTPFADYNGETARSQKVDGLDDRVFVYASDPASDGKWDLSSSVEYDRSGLMDRVTVDLNTSGSILLHILWYGDMPEMERRYISSINVEFSFDRNYNLEDLRLVTLTDEGRIDRKVDIALSGSEKGTRTGESTISLDLSKEEVESCLRTQSGVDRDRLATLVVIRVDGPLRDEALDFDLQWGPEYYHENNPEFLILVVVFSALTIPTMFVFYFGLSKKYPVLVVDHDNGELVISGPEEELSGLHYRLAKVLIRSMPSDRENQDNNEPAGVFKGKEIFGKEGASQIRKEQDDRLIGRKRIIVQECPDCGSNELYYEGGFISGHVYHCKKCDYIGSFVIEREVDLRE